MATNSTTEVVIGSTLKVLAVTILDENGNPRNITGGSVRLQGRSLDLPSKIINVAGTLTDPANGVASWPGVGDPAVYVAEGDLGSEEGALFTLRVRYQDVAGKVDFGPEFEITWVKAPSLV